MGGPFDVASSRLVVLRAGLLAGAGLERLRLVRHKESKLHSRLANRIHEPVYDYVPVAGNEPSGTDQASDIAGR